MNNILLGYWVETATQIYFTRGPHDAFPEHRAAYETPDPEIKVTAVYEYADAAHYVVKRHLKNDVYIAMMWSPASNRPLEEDHTKKIAWEVVDFAETMEEAEAIRDHFKSKQEKKPCLTLVP